MTERKPASKRPPVGMIATASAVKLLMLSEARLRQLASQGHFPKAVRGHYQLVPLVQGYIKFLKDEERRTSIVQADSGLKAARQRLVEISIAEKEGRLIDMEDAEAAFEHAIGVFRSELDGLPASVTRDRKLRAAIEQGLNGAFTRCEARFREAGKALRAGRDPLGTEVDDDV